MGNRGAAATEPDAGDRHGLVGASILVGKSGRLAGSIERQSVRHGQQAVEPGQSRGRRAVIDLGSNRSAQIDGHIRSELTGIVEVRGKVRRGVVAAGVVIDADSAGIICKENIAINGGKVVKKDCARAPAAIVGLQHDIDRPFSHDASAKIADCSPIRNIIRKFELHIAIGAERQRRVAGPVRNAGISDDGVVIAVTDAIEDDDIAIARLARGTRRARATGGSSGGLDGHIAVIERRRQDARIDVDPVRISPYAGIADQDIIGVQQPLPRRAMGRRRTDGGAGVDLQGLARSFHLAAVARHRAATRRDAAIELRAVIGPDGNIAAIAAADGIGPDRGAGIDDGRVCALLAAAAKKISANQSRAAALA